MNMSSTVGLRGIFVALMLASLSACAPHESAPDQGDAGGIFDRALRSVGVEPVHRSGLPKLTRPWRAKLDASTSPQERGQQEVAGEPDAGGSAAAREGAAEGQSPPKSAELPAESGAESKARDVGQLENAKASERKAASADAPTQPKSMGQPRATGKEAAGKSGSYLHRVMRMVGLEPGKRRAQPKLTQPWRAKLKAAAAGQEPAQRDEAAEPKGGEAELANTKAVAKALSPPKVPGLSEVSGTAASQVRQGQLGANKAEAPAAASIAPRSAHLEELQETYASIAPRSAHLEELQQTYASIAPRSAHLEELQGTYASIAPRSAHLEELQQTYASIAPRSAPLEELQRTYAREKPPYQPAMEDDAAETAASENMHSPENLRSVAPQSEVSGGDDSVQHEKLEDMVDVKEESSGGTSPWWGWLVLAIICGPVVLALVDEEPESIIVKYFKWFVVECGVIIAAAVAVSAATAIVSVCGPLIGVWRVLVNYYESFRQNVRFERPERT